MTILKDMIKIKRHMKQESKRPSQTTFHSLFTDMDFFNSNKLFFNILFDVKMNPTSKSRQFQQSKGEEIG